MELYIISVLMLLFAVIAGAAVYFYFRENRKFEQMKIQYAMSSSEEVKLQGIVSSLENENEKFRDRAVGAETKIQMLQEQFSKLESERLDAVHAYNQMEKDYYAAKNEVSLVQQRIADNEKKMQAWEKDKERIFNDAKLAMFETGKAVFNKEAEELNKKSLQEAEAISKKTKEHFDTILQKVNVLSGNIETHDKGINLLFKSMSSPTAVGQFSEVGLSNVLKEYGLIEGQDFIVQYNAGVGEGAKRPDAVLFVRDNVFIIDSKASKFFLELAEAEGTAREQEVLDNIKKTMNKHLTDLSSKGYREPVIAEIKKTRPDFEIGHVQVVMFLCNESHVSKIAHADHEFIGKAIAKDIVISGPTGMQGLLAFARYAVERQKRDDSQEKIIDEVRILLGHISTVIGHAVKVGNSIKASAKHYENFVGSVNSRLLSKAVRITKLGVSPPSDKQLPQTLASFTVTEHSSTLIESEAVAAEEESEDGRARVLELLAS